ncbi:MAG: MoaD/ThiS family protein [Proteobacteria bacterium]|nr:MoaD/ThiS family protein [Pseudomonadota bacterium]MBU2227937.1 MoaD/ThiS family protein [Pseudomonadota bacterium]MBU2260380.1 MoaD/ThiS family protein [Pseudomonadota bacterium]
MKVTFRAFANLREIVGSKEQEISLPEGETVGGLLKGLCEAHPGLERKIFDAPGRIKPFIIVLKNGRSINSLQNLDTVIDEGDVIALFPPIAGG